MLEFQIADWRLLLPGSGLGSDLRLEQERQRLLNHKMIKRYPNHAYTMLDAEEFFRASPMSSAMNDLESIEEYDPSYKELSGQLSETFYALETLPSA